MSHHKQVRLRDPFTGHKVGIDKQLVPVIKALWSLGIETASSCQGLPLYDKAIICFAEPKGWGESPDCWDPVGAEDEKRWDAAAEAWDASRPSGAQQLWLLLARSGAPANVFRWDWCYREVNPGSSLLLPSHEIPLLAGMLAKLPRTAAA
jgi:hypothetical protein